MSQREPEHEADDDCSCEACAVYFQSLNTDRMVEQALDRALGLEG